MVVKKDLAKKIKNKAPKSSGVYIWKDKICRVLYVGKAVNLRSRLLYYTKDKKDLFDKTAKFLSLADSVSWIEVRNELEAILLEMNLIRTLKPKYNSLSKDDKRPLFIHFTKDKFPRIKTARLEIAGDGDFVGPFPSAYKLKEIMKKLRKIFPYCSCSSRRKKVCLYYDLGLCLGVSVNGEDMVGSEKRKSKSEKNNKLEIKKRDMMNRVSTISDENFIERRKQYRKNIRNLKMFLNGKIDKVIKILTKEMKEYSGSEEFEKAEKIKKQIEAIEEVLTDKGSITEYLSNDILKEKLQRSQNRFLANQLGLIKIKRIEGYDIAHTGGDNSTASMVVFTNGLPNTSEYRKFKMKFSKGPNDPLMMYETLLRRFNHDEWELPDVILVDGGKGQVRAARKALLDHNIDIKIVGLAKRLEQLVFWDGNDFEVKKLPMDSPALILLRAVRDEAHRFATTYHKKLRKNKMLK